MSRYKEDKKLIDKYERQCVAMEADLSSEIFEVFKMYPQFRYNPEVLQMLTKIDTTFNKSLEVYEEALDIRYKEGKEEGKAEIRELEKQLLKEQDENYDLTCRINELESKIEEINSKGE